jgi:Domain of unknown function (DUF4124)
MKTLEKIAINQAFGTHEKSSAHVHWMPILAAVGCLLFLVFSRDAHAAAPAQKPKAAQTPMAEPIGTIYKLVDASGRVTYSNTPVSGAKQVELDPITVIPGSPSGSLGDAARDKAATAAQALPPAPLLIPVSAPPLAAIAPLPAIQPSATTSAAPTSARAVAQVTPVATPKSVPLQVVQTQPQLQPQTQPQIQPQVQPQVVNLTRASAENVAAASPNPLGLPVVKLRPNGAAAAMPASTFAAPETVTDNRAPQFTAALAPVMEPAATLAPAPAPEAIAQAKREDARKKMVMSTIADEERILGEVKELLATERKQSDSMRALRASLTTTSDAQKTAANAEVRAQVERHFERVRDLQDQVAMHERNIADMRQKLRGDAVATR